jgi:hypothetical protein
MFCVFLPPVARDRGFSEGMRTTFVTRRQKCPALLVKNIFFNISIEIQALWAWSEFNGYAS